MKRFCAMTFIFFLSGASAQEAFAAIQCASIFAVSVSTTELRKSAEDSILALAQMRLDLDRDQVQGVRNITISVLATNYAAKEKQLIAHFEKHGIMTRSEAMQRLRQTISRLQSETKEVIEVVNKEQKITADLQAINKVYSAREKATFNRIEPGSFTIEYAAWYKRNKTVTITKPFEMMSHLTTAFFWQKIVTLGEKAFTGNLPTTYNFSIFVGHRPPPYGSDSHLIPKTYVSYGFVLEWFTLLNELSKMGEPELSNLIVGHQPGDKYRLPTESEWEFVIRGRGKYKGMTPFGDSLKALNDYAWHAGNSGLVVHPVGEKKPLVVDGQNFYDLLGNAAEWVADYYHPSLKTGVDPDPQRKGFTEERRTARGGHAGQHPQEISSSTRRAVDPNILTEEFGFRMVREVRP